MGIDTKWSRANIDLSIYLWYPQGTAYMCPLGACTCSLHGTALRWTQKALGVDTKDTCPTKPVPNRYFDYTIAGLWGEQKVN